MSGVRERYRAKMATLDDITVPRAASVVSALLVVTVSTGLAVMWFVPWVQTAQGAGVVSALQPEQRTQAISALTSGQIETWHVREGDRVRAGDPIVTLIDTDAEMATRIDAQIAAMEQQLAANTMALQTAQQDLVRRQNLFEQGLVSKRDVEQAEIRQQDLRAKTASTTVELNRVRVSLTRQSMQTKMAPGDGTILRLLAAGNSTYVNSGDLLASFIPDGIERSVVITVRGLDAPLVHPGRQVRLQFDGWPIFQVSGWPSSAVGTFGGTVQFVEPIADLRGYFRVWITQGAENEPWPPERYVRLGSRVRGWVLLDEVRLGYELWRQLNNFPPIDSTDSAAASET